MDVEKRKEIIDRWNKETKILRDFFSFYREKIKKEYGLSEEDWNSLRHDPDTGEMGDSPCK